MLHTPINRFYITSIVNNNDSKLFSLFGFVGYLLLLTEKWYYILTGQQIIQPKINNVFLEAEDAI